MNLSIASYPHPRLTTPPEDPTGLFLAASCWLAKRPPGCLAAASLQAILQLLSGTPRVAVSSPEKALFSGDDSMRCQILKWPALGTGTGVDIVLVFHRHGLAPINAARVAANTGPILVPVLLKEGTATEITATITKKIAEFSGDNSVAAAIIAQSRLRILAGELAGLAYRYPDFSAELFTIIAQEVPAVAIAAPRLIHIPRVQITGPDANTCAAVVEALETQVILAKAGDKEAEFLIAVPPASGWQETDIAALQQLQNQAQNQDMVLLTTAPYPIEVAGSVTALNIEICALAQLSARLTGENPQVASIRAGPKPLRVAPEKWASAVQTVLIRQRREFSAALETTRMAASWLAVVDLAKTYGLNLGNYRYLGWGNFLQILMTAVIAGMAVARLGPWWAGILGGGVVAWVRWRQLYRERIERACGYLRNQFFSGSAPLQTPVVQWLKYQRTISIEL
ncbi:hypothetical protein [Corynebacterium caspium]|uniref:hypothetical protein n=1 Tax=Corynebacterium caspium TaxID=234828 RepID=UPI000369ABAC|nr:hypothetical protein [Corynebacterium caspium]WKD59964.1 hypothetical protein CCASP_07945 [Corynebacterium caspium DSM 44850]